MVIRPPYLLQQLWTEEVDIGAYIGEILDLWARQNLNNDMYLNSERILESIACCKPKVVLDWSTATVEECYATEIRQVCSLVLAVGCVCADVGQA
jgi:hypothetical protein